MQYLKYIFISCIIVMTSCSTQPNSTGEKSDLNSFSIEEQALDQGILRIKLPEKTPKSLSIKTPNGEWFVLQDHEASIETIPQAHFDSVNKLEFDTKKLKGTTWRESIKVTELIFKSSGTYLIYFANNLETETENTFSLQKTINYIKDY